MSDRDAFVASLQALDLSEPVRERLVAIRDDVEAGYREALDAARADRDRLAAELEQAKRDYERLYAEWKVKNEACNQAYAVTIPALEQERDAAISRAERAEAERDRRVDMTPAQFDKVAARLREDTANAIAAWVMSRDHEISISFDQSIRLAKLIETGAWRPK